MLSKALSFEKLNNIRDLEGMNAADGQVIADNCFIRSGHLEDLSEKDKENLKNIVCMIIDFRSDGERAEKPDAIIDGISYVHLPVVDDLTAGITRETKADRNVFGTLALKPEEARKYMLGMYRAFAGDNATRRYAEFIHINSKSRIKRIFGIAPQERTGRG